MALSATGSLTSVAGFNAARSHVPFEPDGYGLVVELSARIRPEGCTLAAVGFGAETTTFGASGPPVRATSPSGRTRV